MHDEQGMMNKDRWSLKFERWTMKKDQNQWTMNDEQSTRINDPWTINNEQ